MGAQSDGAGARATVENIGGIDRTDVSFSPGVTVLTGRNATNRTSFLQAVIAGLGGDSATLKGDADAGEVRLTVDGETHTRTVSRENGRLLFGGEPYTDDVGTAALFAFLLEDNPARQAIVRQDDLREVMLEPVDTAEIRSEIERLKRERQEAEAELDRIESLRERLPELRAERDRLQDQLSEREAELDRKRAELEALDADVGETQAQERELEAAVDDLRETQSELSRIGRRIDTQRESLAASEAERDSLEEELATLPEPSDGTLSELNAELERLREHKSSVERSVSQLQRLLEFNREMLENGQPAFLEEFADDGSSGTSGSITDQLAADRAVCWTCGSEVETERIEEVVSEMETFRREQAQQRSSLASEIEALTERRDELRSGRRERERLERKLREVETEIESRESTIETLETRREELQAEVEALESTVEDLESEAQRQVLGLHKEANQLEFECDSLREDIEDVTEEIASIEETVAGEAEIEARIDSLNEALERQRTRIDRLERDAVESFNGHMETVLDVLEYENIERIWIERVEERVREGRETVSRSRFDLRVVRTAEDGAAYEDTVAHLSESEREVTGLVFALAGYLVHDLHETMPFMMLDSLEALDAERIAALVDYFADYAPYLLVALLPEDASALDDHYERITGI
jgi:DNA repair exonuclease SbcCD ATPase subunit